MQFRLNHYQFNHINDLLNQNNNENKKIKIFGIK